MDRRNFMLGAGGLLAAWHVGGMTAEAHRLMSKPMRPSGHLVIIGGAEDRSGDMPILRRFVELTGRDDPKIAVLAAASALPELTWGRYDDALTNLGVRRRECVSVNSIEEANDPRLVAQITQSDAVLITGGDQRRLMSLIGGSAIERAILHARHAQGACIAGTSAGASAMSRYMLVGRGVSDGMGLVQNAIIDQHFSQRHRLPRLLSAIAGRPQLLGLGIDENTALVVIHGQSIEVIGEGSITLVDGRRMPHAYEEFEPDVLMRMPEMRVMRFAPGTSYREGVAMEGGDILQDMLRML